MANSPAHPGSKQQPLLTPSTIDALVAAARDRASLCKALKCKDSVIVGVANMVSLLTPRTMPCQRSD